MHVHIDMIIIQKISNFRFVICRKNSTAMIVDVCVCDLYICYVFCEIQINKVFLFVGEETFLLSLNANWFLKNKKKTLPNLLCTFCLRLL